MPGKPFTSHTAIAALGARGGYKCAEIMAPLGYPNLVKGRAVLKAKAQAKAMLELTAKLYLSIGCPNCGYKPPAP